VINSNLFGASNLGARVRENVEQVLADGAMFRYRSDGVPSWNARFEKFLAAWSGSAGAVSVNSGTAGLRVALRVAGVKAGDRVLVPAYTFVATALAVTSLGAIPEPVDTTAALGVDLDDLDRRLTPQVRAVIGVHVRGQMADLAPLAGRLAEHGVPLIEDACQAMGASCAGRAAGSIGGLGVLSFQQFKQLSAGEGGAILARNAEAAAACERYADLGAVRDTAGLPGWDEERAVFGENCRMTELQAAILCAQAEDLAGVLTRQRALRDRLRARLAADGVPVVDSADPSGDSASHLLLRARDREHALRMCAAMAADEVVGQIVWDRPYYGHGVFRRAGLAPEQLGVARAPLAEELAPRVVAVPIPPTLDPSQLETVADVVTKAAGGR
jgi:dTDP-4-amino-4,6-dideoxygalactose transaminase